MTKVDILYFTLSIFVLDLQSTQEELNKIAQAFSAEKQQCNSTVDQLNEELANCNQDLLAVTLVKQQTHSSLNTTTDNFLNCSAQLSTKTSELHTALEEGNISHTHIACIS